MPFPLRRMLLKALPVVAMTALTGCSSAGSPEAPGAVGGLAAKGGKIELTQVQRQLVENAVRRIIKDGGHAKIATMQAAAASQLGRANVCGYVSYRDAGGQDVEQQYFIELGPEQSKEAALRGQVAASPAKRAKVEFICRRAGLD